MTRSALASARTAGSGSARADSDRRAFTEAEVMAVWMKGRPIPFQDPAVWRQDEFHNVIRRSAYGLAGHPYGWEVDHVVALGSGGSNALGNLRPLRCNANRRLGGALGALLS